MRLGAYPARARSAAAASPRSTARPEISERHRHRYEVNTNYSGRLEQHGMRFSGMSPDGLLPEMIEYEDHPWFIGVQFHPELKSRPFEPHPLFASFVEARGGAEPAGVVFALPTEAAVLLLLARLGVPRDGRRASREKSSRRLNARSKARSLAISSNRPAATATISLHSRPASIASRVKLAWREPEWFDGLQTTVDGSVRNLPTIVSEAVRSALPEAAAASGRRSHGSPHRPPYHVHEVVFLICSKSGTIFPSSRSKRGAFSAGRRKMGAGCGTCGRAS